MSLVKIEVLDKGHVELIEKLGTDLTVVNSARVSFGATAEQMRERDRKLMLYLASHKHTSPFRHSYLQFRFKAPIFVARQLWKHVIGIEVEFDLEDGVQFSGGFKDTGWNEISGRYVEFEEEFYYPQHWRAQSTQNKQGSDGNLGEEIESWMRKEYAFCRVPECFL